MDWSLINYTVGMVLASVGGVWSLAWWFARQFTRVENIIYETKDAILDKLEYHEKHDDSRFAEVRKDIWEIRIRNARLDGEEVKRMRLQTHNEDIHVN